MFTVPWWVLLVWFGVGLVVGGWGMCWALVWGVKAARRLPGTDARRHQTADALRLLVRELEGGPRFPAGAGPFAAIVFFNEDRIAYKRSLDPIRELEEAFSVVDGPALLLAFDGAGELIRAINVPAESASLSQEFEFS